MVFKKKTEEEIDEGGDGAKVSSIPEAQINVRIAMERLKKMAIGEIGRAHV
mgnify:CR=1 FL=1